ANAIQGGADANGAARREAVETLVLLVGPMMPHLAETCWKELGKTMLVADARWPTADPKLVASDTIVIAVQVNGKRRGEIEIAKGSAEDAVRETALSLDAVQRALQGKS